MHFGWIGTAIIIAGGLIASGIIFSTETRQYKEIGVIIVLACGLITLCYFLALAISTYPRKDD